MKERHFTKITNWNNYRNRRSFYKKLITLLIIFCISFQSFNGKQITFADGTSSVNVKVDYIEEIVTVTAGTGGSNKFYISMDNKSWDILNDSGTLDISNILSNKEVSLYFKGNKDLIVNTIKLPEEDKSLIVNFSVVSGAGIISFTTGKTVEYKKGEFGTWKIATNPMSTSNYEIKGATLYFRTPATTGSRAGKVVAVKIPKRPTPPSVKLDAGKLSITGLKPGETQYRVGDSTNWITFTTNDSKVKYINLQSLLSPSAGANTPIPAGRIELRTMGNDKKLSSGVKVIEITQQPSITDNITLTGTTLKVSDLDTKRGYEYTRVEKSKSLDLNTAKWTSITSKNSVIVPNASVGDKILVRLKSTLDANKQTVLASTYKEFVVTSITTK